MMTLAPAAGGLVGLFVAPWLLVGCGIGALLAEARGAAARRGARYGIAGPAGWVLLWRATVPRPPRGGADLRRRVGDERWRDA